jgi:hypothetical protein
MSAVLNFQTQLESLHCPDCAIQFACPPLFIRERREDGKGFYCPSGHTMSFRETESDRLRRQLKNAEQSVDWWKNSAAAKDRQLKGANSQLGKARAKLKRTETRIANGVCPCCKRSFANLHRHMTTKHPDYTKAE